jgi:hypothetical protein
MSVSLPFCTLSLQLGGEQMPSNGPLAPVQTLFAQSWVTRQCLSSTHAGQVAPPQSTSVSSASLIPSVQCIATQWPLPSQTVPPLSLHVAPLAAFPISQQPEALHEAVTQAVAVPVEHSVLIVQALPPSAQLPPVVVVELPELLVVDELLVAAPPFPLELVAICAPEPLDVVLAAPPVSAGPVNVKCVVQAPTPALTPKSAQPSGQCIRIRTSPACRSKAAQGSGQSRPSTGGSWAPSRRG